MIYYSLSICQMNVSAHQERPEASQERQQGFSPSAGAKSNRAILEEAASHCKLVLASSIARG